MPRARTWTLYAAWGCVAASLLHIVCIFMGQSWFDFLGAPPHYGQMMADGDYLLPVTVTMGIAGVLALWAAYAFSAAGTIKRLPLTPLACGVVAFIFLLRGALGVPFTIYVLTKAGLSALMLFHLGASIFVLTLGIGFVHAFRMARA